MEMIRNQAPQNVPKKEENQFCILPALGSSSDKDDTKIQVVSELAKDQQVSVSHNDV